MSNVNRFGNSCKGPSTNCSTLGQALFERAPSLAGVRKIQSHAKVIKAAWHYSLL